MSDDRFVRLLRTIDDPVAPSEAFLDASFQTVAMELGCPSACSSPAANASRWLAAATILASLVATAAVAGALLRDRQPPDLLEGRQLAGSIQIAVSPGPSAGHAAGRHLHRFDVAVVADLTPRMGLQAEVTPADRMTALAGGSWTVALPSARVGADLAGRWAASEPYYPGRFSVVMPTDDDLQSLDALAGQPVCVVAGTTGEAWLTGRPDVIPLARPDEEQCLDALATGTAVAAVTADFGPADIEVQRGHAALGTPVTSEPGEVLVDRQAGDPTALIHEIDGAIQSARRRDARRSVTQLLRWVRPDGRACRHQRHPNDQTEWPPSRWGRRHRHADGRAGAADIPGRAAVPGRVRHTARWSRGPARRPRRRVVHPDRARTRAPAVDPSGTLLYGTFDGRVLAVDPATGTERWTWQGAGKIGDLAASDGRVFARDGAGKIRAFDVSPPVRSSGPWTR